MIAEKLQATNDGDGLSTALDDFCRLLLLGGPSGTRIGSRVRRGRGDRAHGIPGFAGDALRRGVVDATVAPSRSTICRRFRGTRRAAGASRKAVPFRTRTAQVGLDGGASRANLGRLNRVPFRFCRHEGTVRADQRCAARRHAPGPNSGEPTVSGATHRAWGRRGRSSTKFVACWFGCCRQHRSLPDLFPTARPPVRALSPCPLRGRGHRVLEAADERRQEYVLPAQDPDLGSSRFAAYLDAGHRGPLPAVVGRMRTGWAGGGLGQPVPGVRSGQCWSSGRATSTTWRAVGKAPTRSARPLRTSTL